MIWKVGLVVAAAAVVATAFSQPKTTKHGDPLKPCEEGCPRDNPR